MTKLTVTGVVNQFPQISPTTSTSTVAETRWGRKCNAENKQNTFFSVLSVEIPSQPTQDGLFFLFATFMWTVVSHFFTTARRVSAVISDVVDDR